jgi:hypothetical protein
VASDLPRISVVTACLNRANFLDDALKSVLDQDYPAVEYVVVDGGSTDGSVEVIRRYEPRLAWWVSEKDNGHFHALNKGFARTTGEVMAWLNSDDKYTPWAFQVVGEIFATFPEVQWLTTLYPLIWDARGRATRCKYTPGFSRRGFMRGEYLPRPGAYAPYWIQQESTFWRRSLWERAGGRVDESLRIAGDFELWARFFEHAELYGVATPIGGFRVHGDQLSTTHLEKYVQTCSDILSRHGGRPHGALPTRIMKSRAGRYLPRTIRRLLDVDHPTRTIEHKGPKVGWVISRT